MSVNSMLNLLNECNKIILCEPKIFTLCLHNANDVTLKYIHNFYGDAKAEWICHKRKKITYTYHKTCSKIVNGQQTCQVINNAP
jgi:two-component SAPR family response regulator